MKQMRPLQRGFSLIEIVITLFIIGIAFTLYYVALQNVSISRTAKDEEIALRIANNKMGGLRAAGYINLPPSGAFTDTQLSSIPLGSGSVAVSAFNAQTKQVMVTVSWSEPNISGSRSVVLSTLIVDTGGL
jgi:prepilin-type N-terminal cleavage/methylation domain-containing protein